MAERFIILRRPARGRLEAFRGPGGRPSITDAKRRDLEVVVDEVSRRDIATINRSPETVASAPALPMTLITPLPPESASPAGAPQKVAWGVTAVGADHSPYSGQGITVAVLDSGIDRAHPAFAGLELVEEDFTGEGRDDVHGHGTHCAGTLFGRPVDGTRIGIAPGVQRALIGKVLGANGSRSDQLVRAIEWAAHEGAHVISMSLGIDFPRYVQELVADGYPVPIATSRALEGYRENVQVFERFASYLRSRGAVAQACVIVAAAGNESQRHVDPRFEVAASPPAVADGVLAVAALGRDGDRLAVAPFSNTGAAIAGPGVGILSARPGGGLTTLSGTSMATPHVAGVIALWAEHLRAFGPLHGTQLMDKVRGAASMAGLAPGSTYRDVGAGIARAPQ